MPTVSTAIEITTSINENPPSFGCAARLFPPLPVLNIRILDVRILAGPIIVGSIIVGPIIDEPIDSLLRTWSTAAIRECGRFRPIA